MRSKSVLKNVRIKNAIKKVLKILVLKNEKKCVKNNRVKIFVLKNKRPIFRVNNFDAKLNFCSKIVKSKNIRT